MVRSQIVARGCTILWSWGSRSFPARLYQPEYRNLAYSDGPLLSAVVRPFPTIYRGPDDRLMELKA
jgi:hypothetical protein